VRCPILRGIVLVRCEKLVVGTLHGMSADLRGVYLNKVSDVRVLQERRGLSITYAIYICLLNCQ